MAHSDHDGPIDPKHRAWLLAEIERRVLPMHWRALLQQLASWAQSHRDAKALHDLLLQYPRTEKKP